ncbi:interferon-inducible GTPase-domain-containing protein [Kalaharituber pfeilii]|nr:interferon-inducible GTPase-domain-containing protein [Kalaharituber pfeilii]
MPSWQDPSTLVTWVAMPGLLLQARLVAGICNLAHYILETIFKSSPKKENPNARNTDSGVMEGALVGSQRSKPIQTDNERIRKELGFNPDCLHIAVAGYAGTGKSTLINAFRGLGPKDPFAAPIGVVECTSEIARYPDPRYPWIVWFDIPGGGTTECPATGYFDHNGLYLMDFIIVVCGDRFSELDVEILKGARRWNITAVVVRSKSDIHIRNLAG